MKETFLETTMETICELCKWPYMEKHSYLEDHCEHCNNCPAEAAVKDALEKMELSVSAQFAHAIADSFQSLLEKRP